MPVLVLAEPSAISAGSSSDQLRGEARESTIIRACKYGRLSRRAFTLVVIMKTDNGTTCSGVTTRAFCGNVPYHYHLLSPDKPGADGQTANG